MEATNIKVIVVKQRAQWDAAGVGIHALSHRRDEAGASNAHYRKRTASGAEAFGGGPQKIEDYFGTQCCNNERAGCYNQYVRGPKYERKAAYGFCNQKLARLEVEVLKVR